MKLGIGSTLLLLFFSLMMSPLAEASVSIVGGLTRERKARIGETYKGTIFIKNNDDEPQEVKVYQTDYLFFFDGRSIYGEPGEISRSNARWISFSRSYLAIPPNEFSRVNYTVSVPADKALVGTYWSILMVEEVAKDSPEAPSSEKGEPKLAIRQIIRYGIQMVTHIGDTGARKLKFFQTRLLRQGERRVLQVDIENIGERWLTSFLWAELYGEDGALVGRFEGGRLRTYPGTSARYRIDLTEVPEASYQALVVADCGGEDVFGITHTLKLSQ